MQYKAKKYFLAKYSSSEQTQPMVINDKTSFNNFVQRTMSFLVTSYQQQTRQGYLSGKKSCGHLNPFPLDTMGSSNLCPDLQLECLLDVTNEVVNIVQQ